MKVLGEPSKEEIALAIRFKARTPSYIRKHGCDYSGHIYLVYSSVGMCEIDFGSGRKASGSNGTDDKDDYGHLPSGHGPTP